MARFWPPAQLVYDTANPDVVPFASCSTDCTTHDTDLTLLNRSLIAPLKDSELDITPHEEWVEKTFERKIYCSDL